MKKLWLISVLSLGLVLLAGCGNNASKGQVVSNGNDMLSIYQNDNAMTCTLEYVTEEEQWTSVMYIKDGMIYEIDESTIDGEEVNRHTLARDGKVYVRGNRYWDWVWMSITQEVNVEEELLAFEEIEENTEISCVPWVKNDSLFEIPNDIDFTSMDDFMNFDEGYWEEYLEDYSDVENNVEENNWEDVVEPEEEVVVTEE